MAEYAIVAIGYNRPTSLQRLLRFLEVAEYGNDDVALIISIDHSGDNTVQKCADQFNWTHGDKFIKIYPERLGLRRHILHCGDFVREYRAIAVFEDDVIPSIGFYQYMKQVVPFYENDENIAGISLYSHLWNVNVNMPFQPAYGNADVYFLQFAQSWGQIWMRDSWLRFAEWYEKNSEDIYPCNNLPHFVTGWPDTSWLKYHIKYCVETDKYFVYPYQSLSTCFSDVGEHCQEKDTHLQVPMQNGVIKEYRLINIEDYDAIIYDVFFERLLKNIDIAEGISGNEVSFNLYGSKSSFAEKRYLISSEALPYKILKSYGLELRPHEENVIHEIDGDDIYLYSLSERVDEDNSNALNLNKYKNQREISRFRYFFRMYGKTSMLCNLVMDKVKKKFVWGACPKTTP